MPAAVQLFPSTGRRNAAMGPQEEGRRHMTDGGSLQLMCCNDGARTRPTASNQKSTCMLILA